MFNVNERIVQLLAQAQHNVLLQDDLFLAIYPESVVYCSKHRKRFRHHIAGLVAKQIVQRVTLSSDKKPGAALKLLKIPQALVSAAFVSDHPYHVDFDVDPQSRHCGVRWDETPLTQLFQVIQSFGAHGCTFSEMDQVFKVPVRTLERLVQRLMDVGMIKSIREVSGKTQRSRFAAHALPLLEHQNPPSHHAVAVCLFLLSVVTNHTYLRHWIIPAAINSSP